MNKPQTASQINTPQTGMTDEQLITARQCPECERLMRCAEAQQIQIQRLLIERDQAQAACAEMRAALEMHREGYLDHGHFATIRNLAEAMQKRIAATNHALSSDCGKGWVRVGELANTLEVLKENVGHAADPGECAVCNELSRLEKLIEAK